MKNHACVNRVTERKRLRFRCVGIASASWNTRLGQMARAQLFDIRQFVQISKPKMIQEKLRGFIQERAPGDFGATRDFDQATLH